jgi:hypothetical protein
LNRHLTKDEIAGIPEESWAIIALAEHFRCADTADAVFRAAFAWYYVPLAPDRRAYAERVVAAALRAIEGPNPAPYPDWFWRVHELLITKENRVGSIPPPPDHKH